MFVKCVVYSCDSNILEYKEQKLTKILLRIYSFSPTFGFQNRLKNANIGNLERVSDKKIETSVVFYLISITMRVTKIQLKPMGAELIADDSEESDFFDTLTVVFVPLIITSKESGSFISGVTFTSTL